jgi:hypothetical protein
MKVEAAILQLNLLFIRGYKKHINRMEGLKDDERMKRKIIETYQAISRISQEINLMQNVDKELRSRYDGLIARDKLMEKKFKGDFPTLRKTAIAVLFAQYKKRPRLTLKDVTPHEILDLGKSIVALKALDYLAPECLDYFNQMAIMDNFPANLPPSVDMTHWQNLIALRRLKVNNEIAIH